MAHPVPSNRQRGARPRRNTTSRCFLVQAFAYTSVPFTSPGNTANVGLLSLSGKGNCLKNLTVLLRFWSVDRGQDIAEYAVMLGVILTIVVGTIRLIGSHADNVFSSVGSAIQ